MKFLLVNLLFVFVNWGWIWIGLIWMVVFWLLVICWVLLVCGLLVRLLCCCDVLVGVMLLLFSVLLVVRVW